MRRRVSTRRRMTPQLLKPESHKIRRSGCRSVFWLDFWHLTFGSTATNTVHSPFRAGRFGIGRHAIPNKILLLFHRRSHIRHLVSSIYAMSGDQSSGSDRPQINEIYGGIIGHNPKPAEVWRCSTAIGRKANKLERVIPRPFQADD